MTLFRNYTFTWWQAGLLKLCVLCFGIAIGSYFSDYFIAYITPLVVVGLLLGLYLGFISFKN